MLRSMYSGISGMRGFQTKLDVIGNNIANVNTSGFKKGRLTFQDMMSQTTRGAQGADGNNRGGINPMQVGLGSQVGSIDNIHTQGFLQSTGRPLDIAIEGEGMFVVGDKLNTDGEVDEDTSSLYYTRAKFYFDNDGNGPDENGTEWANIVNADGYFLLGYDVNDEGEVAADAVPHKIQIPTNAQSFSISKNGDVNYVDESGEPQVAGRIQISIFSNPEGLEKVGGNLYLKTNNSGEPQGTTPGENGAGDIAASSLEMSNVDLADEFTEMIVTQRGFKANTRIITTSDEILQELVNLKR